MASTTGRIDTLTDAMVTLRGFVNERMGDVGDAVSRSQTQITRELSDALGRTQSQITVEVGEALARLPTPSLPDVSGALEHTQARITQDLKQALAQYQADAAQQLEEALRQMRTGLTRELDEAITTVANRSDTPATPDFGAALEQAQLQITQDLERALTRIHGQTTKQVDEALSEARSQSSLDLAEAATEAEAKTAQQLTTALDRLEAQTTRRSANDERRHEQTATAVKAGATASEETARRIDAVAAAISTELATVGQRLGDQVEVTSARSLSDLAALSEHLGALVDGITETNRADLAAATRRLTNEVTTAVTATGAESAQHSERVGADISALSESVADALAQVADRLEQLADNNHGQQDVVEAVAEALDDVAARLDDLDSSNRSRHDRMIAAVADLRSKRANAPLVDLEPVTRGLERVETFVEALVDATEHMAGTGTTVADVIERIDRLEAGITEQLSGAATTAVRSVTEAAERAATQIRTAAPPVTERSTLAAITRIEGRMAELTRQRDDHDEAAKHALDNLEETVGRLASAQAEDLERILDTVENAPPPQQRASLSLSAADAERLASIEDQLGKLNRQPRAATVTSDIDGTALEQMANLGSQIEALRRRMAVRARPQAPTLDAKTLAAIADAVAARLAPATAPAPAKARAKRASATPGKSTNPRRRPDS